jgi:hypothetical protein
MKKTVLSLFAIAMAGMILTSCGAKYTPMSEEAKTAKADSIYNATMADHKAQKEKECADGMQAAVDEKVKEMMAANENATVAK